MNVSEKFTHWMELETSYALSKFPAETQYPYWEEGVTRGHFSFMVSALNYVRRARIFADSVENFQDPLGVQLAQSLGKAAHNLVAMSSTANSYTHGKSIQVSSAVDLINTLASDIEVGLPPDAEELANTELNRKKLFLELQELQDSNQIEQFQVTLYPELALASSQFVSAAEHYRWSRPGLSSGNHLDWDFI